MNKIKIENMTWNYNPLLPEEGEKGFLRLRKEIEELTKAFVLKYTNDKSFLQDPDLLREALDMYNKWASISIYGGKEGYYFYLKSTIEKDNPVIIAGASKAEAFALEIGNQIAFFELDIASIPEDKQKILLDDSRLSPYRHFLIRLFAKSRYMLSEKEEKVLSLMSIPAYNEWVSMTGRFISKETKSVSNKNGIKEKQPYAILATLAESEDINVRKEAVKGMSAILKKHVNAGEAELNAVLGYKKITDTLRGYKRPQDERILADNMEPVVVDTLIESVTKRFDISKRYYGLLIQLLGEKELPYFERNISYGSSEKKYSVDEAFEIVQETLGELHPKFGKIMGMLIQNGNYDVLPKKGKEGGAFCASALISLPTYIMLNHTGSLQQVLTLAHETGHGINAELVREKQNALNFEQYTSTAEVASTFMEGFLVDKLLLDAADDKELKLTILMSDLKEIIGTIFRQVAIYNFEVAVHTMYREKGHLSKKEIGKLFVKHMKAYLGLSITFPTGSENGWLYISHIRYYFYVYTYASGLLISHALQKQVKENHGFIEKVVTFLSAGTSDSPSNLFLAMGLDLRSLEFWNQGLALIEMRLTEAEELARVLGKI